MAITLTWYVTDGYVTGDRPQTLTVNLSDFENCESEEDVERLLSDMVQDDFDNNISWSLDNHDELAEKIFRQVQENRSK